MAKNVVIVGAGIAGLTLGSKLADAGANVVLLEREGAVGGLARSFRYTNGATFDIGPHRFHTDDKVVQAFIEETLGENVITISRDSQLYLFGKYLPWPITLKNVAALPPAWLVKAGFDLVFPRKAKTESFEDYIIEKYGKTLYRAFFKPYTEKFLEYTCSNLHRDWASAGINRATIDKQVKTNSLGALIQSVLFSKNPDTKFLYPKSGGNGAFCDILADKIRRQGGRILLETCPAGFETENGRIRGVTADNGDRIPADYVFWSGSLRDLHAIGRAPQNLARLHYISTVLFNYLVSGHIKQGFQWCYFGDADMEVDRISVPRNFNPDTVPPGKEGLCIEMTCTEDSAVWNDPSRVDCVVETFLLHARLIDSLDSVEDVHIEHVPQTYPLYALNYPRKLRNTFDWIESSWSNLLPIGRTGRFWYNNMDHSIQASLRIADRFVDDLRQGSLRPSREYAAEDRSLGEEPR